MFCVFSFMFVCKACVCVCRCVCREVIADAALALQPVLSITGRRARWTHTHTHTHTHAHTHTHIPRRAYTSCHMHTEMQKKGKNKSMTRLYHFYLQRLLLLSQLHATQTEVKEHRSYYMRDHTVQTVKSLDL